MSRHGRILSGVGVVMFLLLAAGKMELNHQRQADHASFIAVLAKRNSDQLAIEVLLALNPHGFFLNKWPLISRETMPKDGGGEVEIDRFRTTEGDMTVSIDGTKLSLLHTDFTPPPQEHVAIAWTVSQWSDLILGICAALAWAVALVHAILERSVRIKSTKLSFLAAMLVLATILLATNDLSYWLGEGRNIILLPVAMMAGTGLVGLWIYFRRPFPAGSCARCGYDLTGNLSGICPECGRAVGTVGNAGSQHGVAEN